MSVISFTPRVLPMPRTTAHQMQDRRRAFLGDDSPCGCTGETAAMEALRAVLRSDPTPGLSAYAMEIQREARMLLADYDDARRTYGAR